MNHRQVKGLTAILVLIWGSHYAAQAQESLPPEVVAYADWVLYNGKVLTADDRFTVAQAVAIRDGKFLAVGTTDRILKMAGPNTKKVDLQGKAVAPGFYDTHFHLHNYALRGVSRPRIRWGDTVESGLQELAKVVQQTPPGQWIVLDMAVSKDRLVYGQRAVTRQHLDTVSPQNPVSIRMSTSTYLLNSRALELAAIPLDTPGLIKDPNTGQPNGHLWGWAAGMARYELLPWYPLEKLIPPLKEGMARYNAQGMTMVSTRLPGNEFTAIREIWARGELTMRWRVNHEMTGENPQLEKLLKRVGNLSDMGDEMFRIAGGYTDPPDGGLIVPAETWTLKPKKRLPPDRQQMSLYGLGNWEDEEHSERKSVVLLARYGWNLLGMHSVGDRATEEVLKAYEEGKKNPVVVNPRQKLAVDHALMVTPEQMDKMKRLGVIPSVAFSYMVSRGDQYAYLLGEDVMKLSPVKGMIQAGLRPVAEADNGELPFSSPLWNMEKYITRKDEKGIVWGPQEGITRQQALWMYTNWAAYYTGDEKKLGTIEPGKLADLVVLEGDYLATAEEKISDIPVALTMVGGKVVYDRSQGPPLAAPRRTASGSGREERSN